MTEKIINKKNDRVVRVFISSTFRDMMAERDELALYVFPELRRRCRERYVEFDGVDLRWGITEEQSKKGEVLPICLAMIERCHPYFVGMLGERYGWGPGSIDAELLKTQAWIGEHGDKSVTELEIIHGVLNDLEMKSLSYFYFRDKDISLKVEEGLAREKGYEHELEAAKDKLTVLKKKIMDSGCMVREGYPDAKTLGQFVLEDLWSAIDKKFPASEVPSRLERERMDHEAFAEARRKVYIGRQEYFDTLDAHVLSDGLPQVLLGESGSGKSALLANWTDIYREKHPKDFTICHYIGGTPDSADHVAMLRRIMEEIRERYDPTDPSLSPLPRGDFMGGEGEIPTDPKKVIEAFPLWLAKAAGKGNLILVLDALNQLEDKDNALDLGWLPSFIPANVRLILSTLPGRSMDELKKRDWMELAVLPMNRGEQAEYINKYLEHAGRKLDKAQIGMIVNEEQASNPLYLRTLLEELKVFGVYEKLNEKIAHYLQARTVDGLFGLMLERLEEHYERDRQGLVKEALTLIWAARMGLYETELLDLLGTNGKPMPRAHWSPLFLALEDSLVSRAGLLNFFHDYLRIAVERKYLPDEAVKKAAYMRLAGYFEKCALDDRKVDELPWQLQQAEAWTSLKASITDMEMFLKFNTQTKQYELTGYWLSLDEQFDMVAEYDAMLKKYEKMSSSEEELANRLNDVAVFLRLGARYDGAEPLYRRALAIRETALGKEHPLTAESLNRLALMLRGKGDDAGEELYIRRALVIREKMLGSEHPDTAESYNNLARVLERKGDFNGAELLYRKAMAIYVKMLGKYHPNTVTVLNNIAAVLYKKNDNEGAEPLMREVLAVREKVLGMKHPLTAMSLNNLACCLDSNGNYQDAIPFYRRALAINQEVLGAQHPSTIYIQEQLDSARMNNMKLSPAKAWFVTMYITFTLIFSIQYPWLLLVNLPFLIYYMIRCFIDK